MNQGYEEYYRQPDHDPHDRSGTEGGWYADDWSEGAIGRHAASAETNLYGMRDRTSDSDALEHARSLAEQLRRVLYALPAGAGRATDPNPDWRYADDYSAPRDDPRWAPVGSVGRSWSRQGPAGAIDWAPAPVPYIDALRRPLALPSADRPTLRWVSAVAAARLIVLFIAGAMPVLSISLQVFGLIPLAVAARYIVIPMTFAALIIMLGPSVLGAWAVEGAIAGLVAVTAYDAVRLPLTYSGFMNDFIPQVGGWALGSDSPNVFVGYLWRFLGDGGGIGLSYFAVCGVVLSIWPALIQRSPVALSLGYGVFVWSGLIATIVLSASGASLLFPLTPVTFAISLVGHLIYGGVLGICLRRALANQPLGAWPGPPPMWLTRMSDRGRMARRRSRQPLPATNWHNSGPHPAAYRRGR